MYGFDFNVVNVALPTLQHDLHAGPAALELVTGGYAFSHAAGLVTGGRLGLAASAPVMAAALAWEQRLARVGGQPLVDLSLFRQRSFAAGLAISAAFMAVFTSSVFISSLLLQDGLGLTALRAGLSFGPMALTGIAAPLIGRRLIPRFGPFRVMVAGSLINAAGLLTLALALRALGGAVTLPWTITTLAAMGLGNMLILPALIGVALADIRPEQAGVASGTLNTTQQFGGSAGIVAIGALFFAALGPHPGRASFVHATASAVWIDLGLTLVIAALSAVLAPRRAGPPVINHPASLAGNTTAAPAPGTQPAADNQLLNDSDRLTGSR